MSTLSDEELVARCKSELPDNTHSYEVLLQRHMSHVYNVIYRIIYNLEEIEKKTSNILYLKGANI